MMKVNQKNVEMITELKEHIVLLQKDIDEFRNNQVNKSKKVETQTRNYFQPIAASVNEGTDVCTCTMMMLVELPTATLHS